MDTWMESQSRNWTEESCEGQRVKGGLKHLASNVFNTKSAILGGTADSSQI